MNRPADSEPPAPVNETETGLPFFRTWRGVYVFVFGCFLVWVVMLFALTLSFS